VVIVSVLKEVPPSYDVLENDVLAVLQITLALVKFVRVTYFSAPPEEVPVATFPSLRRIS